MQFLKNIVLNFKWYSLNNIYIVRYNYPKVGVIRKDLANTSSGQSPLPGENYNEITLNNKLTNRKQIYLEIVLLERLSMLLFLLRLSSI